MRLRHGWESWDQKLKVIIDKVRREPSEMPLLKSRKRMGRNLAIQSWGNLLTAGWRRTRPQWE